MGRHSTKDITYSSTVQHVYESKLRDLPQGNLVGLRRAYPQSPGLSPRGRPLLLWAKGREGGQAIPSGGSETLKSWWRPLNKLMVSARSGLWCCEEHVWHGRRCEGGWKGGVVVFSSIPFGSDDLDGLGGPQLEPFLPPPNFTSPSHYCYNHATMRVS